MYSVFEHKERRAKALQVAQSAALQTRAAVLRKETIEFASIRFTNVVENQGTPISGSGENRTRVLRQRPVLSLRGLFALELEVKFVVATADFSDGVFIFIKAIYSAVMISAFKFADKK